MEILKQNYKNIIKKILSILIYRLSLDLIYVTIIVKFVSYGNFRLNVEIYKYIISIIVTCIAAIPIYDLINLEKPSNVIVTLFNFMYFIPGTVMYALYGFSNEYFCFFIFYWALLLFFQYKIDFKITKEKFLKNRIKDYRFVIAIVLFFIIISFLISGIYNGFRLNFSLSNIYELRSNAKEITIPTLLQYLRTWATKIIPIGLAIALLKNKKVISVLLILSQLLLFSFDGTRTTLFILAFVILAYLLLNEKSYDKFFVGFTILGIFLNIIGVIFQKVPLIMNYFHRRMMFLPSMLSNYYYEFFAVNEKLFLRQSILGKFGFENPYDVSANYLISDVFFNKINMSSNNGLLGDAFANFGWYSLLFYPLMIIILLKIIDFAAENINIKIVFVTCVEIFIALTNQSFFTAILTGGILITIFFFMLFPKDEEIVQTKDLYEKLEAAVIQLWGKSKKFLKNKNS